MSDSQTRTFECAPFPTVTIEADSGYWSGAIKLGGITLPMSIYVDASVSELGLKDAKAILGDLLTLTERARAAMSEWKDKTIMRDFFQFHLEEVPECLPEAVRTEATNEAFVGALKLVGVAIHADDDAAFELVLDFSFGREHSDELLAVKLSPNREILQVCHES